MKAKNDDQKEGIYYRAIAFSNVTILNFEEFANKAGLEVIKKNTYSETKFLSLEVKSPLPPPYCLRKLLPDANGMYTYNLFGIELKYIEKQIMFVASPLTEILLSKTNQFDNKYILPNLNQICNHNICDSDRKNIDITRLNVKVLKEEANNAESLIFYGKDILTSQIIRIILGEEAIENGLKEGGPFSPKDITKMPRIVPNSCKLHYDDGMNSFGLNLDTYGNFSYFIKYEKNIHYLIFILNYLISLESFKSYSSLNPIIRNPNALKEIEK